MRMKTIEIAYWCEARGTSGRPRPSSCNGWMSRIRHRAALDQRLYPELGGDRQVVAGIEEDIDGPGQCPASADAKG